MLEITCPICHAKGDEIDFTAGGEAYIKRPATQDPQKVTLHAHYEYLYIRTNPKGPRNELWHCTRGCSKWFIMKRDTMTLEIIETKCFDTDLASEIKLDNKSAIPKQHIKKTPTPSQKTTPSNKPKTKPKKTSKKN